MNPTSIPRDSVAVLIDREVDQTEKQIAMLSQHRDGLRAARKALTAISAVSTSAEGDSGLDKTPIATKPRRRREFDYTNRGELSATIVKVVGLGYSGRTAIVNRVLKTLPTTQEASVLHTLYRISRKGAGQLVDRIGTSHHYRYYPRGAKVDGAPAPAAPQPEAQSLPAPPAGAVLTA